MQTKYPTTELIKKFLNKYIPQNKDSKKGLFLLPSQTGSGKTHATVQYMADKIISNSNETMIYIVHTKHNVEETYDKLLDCLDKENYKKVILIKNNYTSILESFEKQMDKIDGFKYLPCIEEFQTLKQSIEIALSHKDIRDSKAFKKSIEKDNIYLKKALTKVYKNRGIDNYDGDIDISEFKDEVAILYPSVNLHKYSAIFMTTHKFFFPIFQLKDSTPLYRDKKFKNYTIFIDEFDSQKRIILDLIIKNKNKNKYEFIDLFTRIKDTLTSKQFTKKYSIKENIIDSIKSYYERTYQKYNMHYNFKHSFNETLENQTILTDSTLSDIIQKEDKSTKIMSSIEDEINYITDNGELSFLEMIRDINNGLKMFIGLSRGAVRREVRLAKERDKELSVLAEDEIEIIDRITHDLIKELGYHIGDAHYQYLSETIKYNVFEKRNDFKSSVDELYEDGFKLININQKSRYSKTNNFELLTLSNTPEKFIKDLCNHMFVVGISATATIPTLTRNFDIKYLKRRLANSYFTLDTQEISQMDNLYITAKNQTGRDIHIEYIQPDENLPNLLKKYYGKNEILLSYMESIRNKRTTFFFNRYIKVVHAYREFLLHNEIESFIYLQSSYFKKGKPLAESHDVYLEELVLLIFVMLKENVKSFSKKIQNKVKELINLRDTLDNEEFIKTVIEQNILFYLYNSEPNNKEEYKKARDKKLQADGKFFILSSYQAMGVGVNIEYKGKETEELKDFDAICMDMPTNFTTRYFIKDRQNNQIKALYELESLRNYGYFTRQEYRRYAKDILSKPNSTMPYNNSTDYYNSVMSVIIQAVGRLYRTENDTSKMFLFLSHEVANAVKNFDSSNQSLLPAVNSLIQHTNTLYIQSNNEDEKLTRTKNKFARKNKQLEKKIRYMLQVFSGISMRADIVAEWEDYRKWLISNPTVENDYSKFDLCYEKMPLKYNDNRFYWYNQEEDYKDVDISFVNSTEHPSLVSSHGAMLDVIANTKELKECIETHNIALEFEYEHIMTPIAFNNLYKGALGETIGRFLVQKFAQIELLSFDIDHEEYERFDYKTEDNNVYFDFKYYSQITIEGTTQNYLIDKAKNKLRSMNANKAVLVNIFASIEEYHSRKYTLDDNVLLIPYMIDITDRMNPKLEYNMIKVIKEFVS